ncbi:MAG: FtsX-like permease family protein [Bacteroidetes bacterium]|nr:FtsX-like permease family protein [Bacteroidota bacterium]
MNLSLFIAKRYFLSTRKKNFINAISIISMGGVAFSTAALIIVLSVFNGLGDLLRSLNTTFDPEIKVEAVKGKSFEVDSVFLQKIKAIEGVETVTEVIEDYALVRYRDADIVVTIKGLSDNFINQHRLDDHIVEGKLRLRENGINYAIIGRGVRYALNITVENNIYPLQVYYIKNAKASSLDISKLYARRDIEPGSVFSIEKNYDDNYIFLPLAFAQDLLDYGNKRTSLEIKTKSATASVQQELQKLLGDRFSVLTNEQQHKDIYKLLKMEKLFTFLALTLLILVASINIFFSLMMLVIDKKKDVAILSAVGASPRLIRNIFLSEGALIAFLGAGIGLVFGGTICWLQDQFGLVGMGMENSLVVNYPVKLNPLDFLSISAVMIAITLLISFYPASVAAKSFSTEDL